MENKTVKTTRIAQGFNASPQVYLNQDRGSITHRLGSDLKIEMPVNLYKKILGLPFEKKENSQNQEATAPRKVTYGLVARPVLFLSEDGNYLIHSVLGIRISKHVNYYKQILGVSYTPKTQTA
ncbi:MAG: hypothetical protein IPJ84_03855 [Bdellovibrionales bacterium]|nr:hypothetical protein [Bdellovibrionales bacterium]